MESLLKSVLFSVFKKFFVFFFFLKVFCVLFFEKCFIVCFEKLLVVGVIAKNPFGNYCVRRVFQCLKSENTSKKISQIGV